jgi:hypothetical protein
MKIHPIVSSKTDRENFKDAWQVHKIDASINCKPENPSGTIRSTL